MSIDNIQLPPFMVQKLFAQSLVEPKDTNLSAARKETSALQVLGKNLKRVVVVVSNSEATFIQDDELNFLLDILSACRLTLDDVCILNVEKNAEADYTIIAGELKAEKIFLFGTDAGRIKLPLSFPDYQVQRYNNQVYFSAPALYVLQQDKAEKTKLWNCLKQVFSI